MRVAQGNANVSQATVQMDNTAPLKGPAKIKNLAVHHVSYPVNAKPTHAMIKVNAGVIAVLAASSTRSVIADHVKSQLRYRKFAHLVPPNSSAANFPSQAIVNRSALVCATTKERREKPAH